MLGWILQHLYYWFIVTVQDGTVETGTLKSFIKHKIHSSSSTVATTLYSGSAEDLDIVDYLIFQDTKQSPRNMQ